MSKERKGISQIFLGTSLVLLFLDSLINIRLYLQAIGYEFGTLLEIVAESITKPVLILFAFAGISYSILFIKVFCVFMFTIYVFIGTPSASDERPSRWVYLAAFFGVVFFFGSVFISPFRNILIGQIVTVFSVTSYSVFTLSTYIVIASSFGKIGKWLAIGGSSGMKEDMEDDPFGEEERRFNQTTNKIENKYSVNIPYKFYNAKGILTKGWINFINPFRGNQVIGTPGSGKSFTFFLAAIEQFIEKGFTMLVYDFKYRELSTYALNCLKRHEGKIKGALGGILPKFCVLTFDNPLESERCNVLQPANLKDFTVDAYGASNIFLTALNRTWSTKEGDFFPESAKNLTAAGIWALKRYKGGKLCTLPHLVEFLSMDTQSMIECMIKMKDNSLSNVIRPFEEALRDGALEQLQGQMGTVRIAMSRLTSPTVYWILTEDPTSKPFSLEINSKTEPKILCLGSSGKNQMVNNIFFSLFIAQIFRMVNVKGRNPLGVMLDEVVTLSFPKGTLDTLIATARSNKISVWLGFQDLSQLIRDFTKDVAEALFKMIGNTVSGNVEDDTAERMMKRIGKMRVMKKSMSISTDGDPSFSYSETFDYAVPESFFGKLSQGNFAGKLADDFGQRLKNKAFYGESEYMPFFNDDNMPHQIEITEYWKEVFEKDCAGMNEEAKSKHVDLILQNNFERIRQEVEEMRVELIGGGKGPL